MIRGCVEVEGERDMSLNPGGIRNSGSRDKRERVQKAEYCENAIDFGFW